MNPSKSTFAPSHSPESTTLKHSLSPKPFLTSLFSEDFISKVKNELNHKNQSTKIVHSIDQTKKQEINKYKVKMNLLSWKWKSCRRR